MTAHLMQNGAEALRKILEHLRSLDTPVGQVDHDPAQCDGEYVPTGHEVVMRFCYAHIN